MANITFPLLHNLNKMCTLVLHKLVITSCKYLELNVSYLTVSHLLVIDLAKDLHVDISENFGFWLSGRRCSFFSRFSSLFLIWPGCGLWNTGFRAGFWSLFCFSTSCSGLWLCEGLTAFSAVFPTSSLIPVPKQGLYQSESLFKVCFTFTEP